MAADAGALSDAQLDVDHEEHGLAVEEKVSDFAGDRR